MAEIEREYAAMLADPEFDPKDAVSMDTFRLLSEPRKRRVFGRLRVVYLRSRKSTLAGWSEIIAEDGKR